MMPQIPAPEAVALVRRLYREGCTVEQIVAESGVRNLDHFYGCLDGRYPDGSGEAPAPIPRRRPGMRRWSGNRAALVERMWRTAELQVEKIEDRLEVAGLELAERESNTRMFAIVAKTLRELSAVDAANKPRGKEASKDDDDDAPPRNIDDLRRALAEKLERFVASREAAVSGEPE
jgi:hypothetical protein